MVYVPTKRSANDRKSCQRSNQ